MDRPCITHGRDEKLLRLLVDKRIGKRPHWKPRHKRENNVNLR